MIKEYTSRILEDGHLFIPEDIVKELDIKSDTALRVIVVKVDENVNIEIPNSKKIDLKKFSFNKSRELLRDYKGSLSDVVIEERRIAV